jgi:hypothetical protein
LYVVGGKWDKWFGGLTCDFWAVFEEKKFWAENISLGSWFSERQDGTKGWRAKARMNAHECTRDLALVENQRALVTTSAFYSTNQESGLWMSDSP